MVYFRNKELVMTELEQKCRYWVIDQYMMMVAQNRITNHTEP